MSLFILVVLLAGSVLLLSVLMLTTARSKRISILAVSPSHESFANLWTEYEHTSDERAKAAIILKLLGDTVYGPKAFEKYQLELANRVDNLARDREYAKAYSILDAYLDTLGTIAPRFTTPVIGALYEKVSATERTLYENMKTDLTLHLNSSENSTSSDGAPFNRYPFSKLPADLQDRLRTLQTEYDVKVRKAAIARALSNLEDTAIHLEPGTTEFESEVQRLELNLLSLQQDWLTDTSELQRIRELLETLRRKHFQRKIDAKCGEQGNIIQTVCEQLESYLGTSCVEGESLKKIDEMIVSLAEALQSYEENARLLSKSPSEPIESENVNAIMSKATRLKTHTYSLWALSQMKSARSRVEDETHWYNRQAKKKDVIEDALSETLWLVDDAYLTPSVYALFHDFHQQILGKVKENRRLELVKAHLITERRSPYEIKWQGEEAQ